jgi:hypothetical protein
VLWDDPVREASRWSRDKGIVVKRKGNPKEATVEAAGLVEGQPTSRHYGLLIYDDVVTQDLVTSPERSKRSPIGGSSPTTWAPTARRENGTSAPATPSAIPTA